MHGSVIFLLLITFHPLLYGYQTESSDYTLNPSTTNKSSSDRTKRSLVIFPTGSIFQISLGIAIASEVQPNTGQVNFGFQQNIKLPTNITELRYPPQARNSRQLKIYGFLEDIIGSYGFNGPQCLQKTICQIAENPLDEGLLEDVINFIFTPSVHMKDEKENGETNDRLGGDYAHKNPYLFSENLGKSRGNCSSAFLNCPQTFLDIISRLFIDP